MDTPEQKTNLTSSAFLLALELASKSSRAGRRGIYRDNSS